MGFSGGSIENNSDVGKLPHREHTLNAAIGDRHSHAVGSLQAVGFGIDSDKCADFEDLGRSKNLDQQISADVSGTENRNLSFIVIYHRTH